MSTLSIVSIVAGLILSTLSIINLTVILKEKAKEPAVKKQEELETLKEEVKELKAENKELKAEINDIKNNRAVDREHTTELEETIRALLRGMSELLTNGINGNNIEGMKTARDILNQYIY